MSDQNYNGYVNRETWLVSLWLSNEEPLYRHAVSLVADLDDGLKEYVTDIVTGGLDGMRLDMMSASLSRVDWQEVAESFREDAE
jgi:hypothetical protein